MPESVWPSWKDLIDMLPAIGTTTDIDPSYFGANSRWGVWEVEMFEQYETPENNSDWLKLTGGVVPSNF